MLYVFFSGGFFMKKIFMLLVFCLFGAIGLFAQSEVEDEKTALEKEASPDMKALQTAYSLAEYGYENNSASALIEAAEILAQIQTQKLETEVNQEGEKVGTEKADAYTAEKLIADGKKLAGKDKSLAKWIAEVEKLVKNTSGTRGAMGGPKIGEWCIYGNGGRCYCNIMFRGGELAAVLASSYNSCDLDIYIYDKYGNLVVKDSSYALDAFVSWYPRYDAIYKVVVKNASQKDAYCIVGTN